MNKKANFFKPLLLAVFVIVLVFCFPLPNKVYAAISTYNEQIQNNTDDARVADGVAFQNGGAALNLNYGVYSVETGLRWENVNIPPGSIITSAVIKVRAYKTEGSFTPITIRGFDVDDVGTFLQKSDIQNPDKTTASVEWITGNWTIETEYYSPDITSVIQEIIDRPGWVSGNALGIYSTSPSGNPIRIRARNYIPGNQSAYLRIEWCPSPLPEKSQASGWAWSENIGWISFNSSNCDTNNNGHIDSGNCGGDDATTPVVEYEVNVDSDGYFSGYAWAGGGQDAGGSPISTIGWISFEPNAVSGCDDGPPCQAQLDTATNKVSGWARACSVFQSDCSGFLDDNAAWDGWIKLRGQEYGVSLNTCSNPYEFEGWAWSDMNIGWTSFNCNNPESGNVCGDSDYKVMLIYPPTATDLEVVKRNYCNSLAPPIALEWNYVPSSYGGNQASYQIEIDTDSAFSSPRGCPNNATSTKIPGISDSCSPLDLSYNITDYYWRLKVWDHAGINSGWIYPPNATSTSPGDSFSTPLHRYPLVDNIQFDYTPDRPSIGEAVDFCTIKDGAGEPCENLINELGLGNYLAICYDNNNDPYSCFDEYPTPPSSNSFNTYRWEIDTTPTTTCIGGSDPLCSSLPLGNFGPVVSFSEIRKYTVTLFVEDESLGGKECYDWVEVPVSLLPEWKEVIPITISWLARPNFAFQNLGGLNRFLANVSKFFKI